MQNILTRKITSKRTIKAVLIAVGMGIGFIIFGGVMLLSLYLGDKYIYHTFYTQIFQEPVWYIFLSLSFIITSLLGIWIVFKVKKIKSNNKSFTLIELLVVIAIIGVLAAIIITTISGAITKSRIVRLQVFSDSIRAQLSDSLVSYWSFNEGTGTTTYDQWEGNNGTLGGGTPDYYPTWRSGGECVSGKCLEFDGSNDYVNVGNDASLDMTIENFTLEIWINAIDNQSGIKTFLSNYTGGGDYMFLGMNNEIPYFVIRGGGVSKTVSSITNIGGNGWYYLVGVRNGDYLYIYVNGISEGTPPSGADNLDVDGGTLYIGMNYATNYPFTGLIDEVRIYNSAATITQIQSQYLAGLDKLLSNGAISQLEYNQRIKELSKEIVIE